MEKVNLFLLYGISSFLVYLLSDYLEYKGGEIYLKSGKILGCLSVMLLLLSVIGLIIFSPKWQISLPFKIIAALFSFLNLLLTVKSLFLEVSFFNKGKETLVTEGSYKLCRHPGVLWLFLFLIFLSLATGSIYLFYGAFLFFALNMIIAISEDKIFLPAKFSKYEDYKKRVPFLLPHLRDLFRYLK